MLKVLSLKHFSSIFFHKYSTAIICQNLAQNTKPSILISTNNSKPKLNKALLDKVKNLPIKINTNHLDLNTLERLNLSSNEFLSDLLQNLNTFGIKDKHLTDTLKYHDDWSLLTYDRLNQVFQMFRELSFTSEIYLEIFPRCPKLVTIEKRKIEIRLNEFKQFFTNKQTEKLFVRTPDLLICNFDSFTYKFTYLFVLMGMNQDEQSRTNVYNHSLDHIRQRHLFLTRSGFFDKPNKKGISKVQNPKLSDIMDTNTKEFLRICTNNLFDLQEFETFCEYLKKENFEDELLGHRIGSSLQNKIIHNVKQSKYEEYEN